MRDVLTEREKAVLTYAAYEGIKDWRLLYKLAKDMSVSDAEKMMEHKSFANTLSKWKTMPAVSRFYATKCAEKEAREQALVDKARKEWLKSGDEKRADMVGGATKSVLADDAIDFTDRDQFLEHINAKLNSGAMDEKDRQTYLKMISDNLRFKEDKPDKEENEIMKFYVPLTCEHCALYREANGGVDEEED